MRRDGSHHAVTTPPTGSDGIEVEFLGHRLILQRLDRPLRDLLMILEGAAGNASVGDLCRKYGYRSTRSYYARRRRFEAAGVAGLLPRRPGPKRRSRRTVEVERLVVQLRLENPDMPVVEVVRSCQSRGLRISERSVERVLSEFGLVRCR